MLNLITKLESLANKGLLWLFALIVRAWEKFCPQKIQVFLQRCHRLIYVTIPAFFHRQLNTAKAAPKEIMSINFKGLLSSALTEGLKAFHQLRNESPLKALWAVITVPFVYLMNWTKSLHPFHRILLTSFTLGSIISSVMIGKAAYQILYQDFFHRSPASVDDQYIRPDYYKQDTRTSSLSSVKIPAIVDGVNGLRSVLVDVSFIASNRETKKILDANEFSIRDHLIISLEPVLPQFALTDEGREMLKEKLEIEVNQYLKTHNAPGFVEETHITHILSH